MNRYEILKNRLGLSGGIGGGGGSEEPKMKPLSHEQVTLWSDFADKNKSIKSLDEMYSAFSAQYPKSGIDKNNLRMNLDTLMGKLQDRGKAWGYDRPDLMTPGLSFPMVYYNETPYGRMNAFGQTKVPVPQPNTQYPEKFVQKSIPDDVKDIWYDEVKGLWAYDDPHEGVTKFASKEAANTPRVRELVKKLYDAKQQGQ